MIEGALIDGLEALSKDIGLNLIAAISIINRGDLISIGKSDQVGGSGSGSGSVGDSSSGIRNGCGSSIPDD